MSYYLYLCPHCMTRFQDIEVAHSHERTCSKAPTLEQKQIADLKTRLAFLRERSNARWTVEMRKAVDIRIKNWRSK